ncbi:MAG: putative enzyme related to lactoylglutathione lyase, partial [Neolewinella sp.]
PWRMISPEQGSMALFRDCEGNRIGVRGRVFRQ